MLYDVVIVGEGPGGLSAALALGRSRKRVLICDSGPRRNAAADHINNFVTRDGVPPDEFRREGRQQLSKYPNVETRDVRVESISGTRGAFQVRLASEAVEARRILLCTGMIDEMLPIDGFRELWGGSIFQCPYCHGWESQDRRWGYLGGTIVPCEVLFAHPPQRQVELVRASGVALDDDGYVRVDAMRRETSVPGIYAAGDLTTRLQGAIFAAALGTQAAAIINVELTMELASSGAV